MIHQYSLHDAFELLPNALSQFSRADPPRLAVLIDRPNYRRRDGVCREILRMSRRLSSGSWGYDPEITGTGTTTGLGRVWAK